MKKLIQLAVIVPGVIALMSAEALADGAWSASGNVALTTDYKFRGISQSNEEAAIQGGFDVAHEAGFYVGAWGSSVDFDTDDGDYDGSLELDVYLGYGAELGDTGWAWDLGFLYYDYPGDDGAKGDYQEIYLGLGWEDLALGFAYSSDYYAETGDFWYLYADYSFALPNDFTLGLHVGYNRLEGLKTVDVYEFLDAAGMEVAALPADGTGTQNVIDTITTEGGFFATKEDTYVDYSVSISREVGGIDIALAYVGTNLDEEDVFGTEWGEGILQFTLSKSL